MGFLFSHKSHSFLTYSNFEKKNFGKFVGNVYICSMISDRIRKTIFEQLYKELSGVEIIPYQDSIFFINRETKYWYFEYEKKGTLWWRYSFFESFFSIFTMESDEFQPILSEWIEEVLNRKVIIISPTISTNPDGIDEIVNVDISVTNLLNCSMSSKVETPECDVNEMKGINVSLPRLVDKVLDDDIMTTGYQFRLSNPLNEVLECKILSNCSLKTISRPLLNEVLECKVLSSGDFIELTPNDITTILEYNVNTMKQGCNLMSSRVDEALNCKVLTTLPSFGVFSIRVNEALNCKVLTTNYHKAHQLHKVNEALNCKVLTTYSNPLSISSRVDDVLNGET